MAAKIKILGKSYAACSEHAALALDHLAGRTADIRRTTDEGYSCICGKVADFHILETEPVEYERLQEYAIRLVVESYAKTWQSATGIWYRKTNKMIEQDQVAAMTACKIMADYLGLGNNAHHVYMQMRGLAEAGGRMKYSKGEIGLLVPANERDQEYVNSLTVRARP